MEGEGQQQRAAQQRARRDRAPPGQLGVGMHRVDEAQGQVGRPVA